MKDAFQGEDEVQEGDIVMGPNGKPALSPEAQARKTARDREKSEAVSVADSSCSVCADLTQKARVRRERVDKLAENVKNKLAIFAEAASSPTDKPVTESFKVRPSPTDIPLLMIRPSASWKQSEPAPDLLTDELDG